MTLLYPMVLEAEDNGATSAYVPGLPVYAAADSAAKAERAIRAVLTAYLKAHPDTRPGARVRVACLSDKGMTQVDEPGRHLGEPAADQSPGHATRRRPSTCRSHASNWFQLTTLHPIWPPALFAGRVGHGCK
jgi:hypothetical protein